MCNSTSLFVRLEADCVNDKLRCNGSNCRVGLSTKLKICLSIVGGFSAWGADNLAIFATRARFGFIGGAKEAIRFNARGSGQVHETGVVTEEHMAVLDNGSGC